MGLGDDCMHLCEDVFHTAVVVSFGVVRKGSKNKVHQAEEKTCGVAHWDQSRSAYLDRCGQCSMMLDDAYLDVRLMEALLDGTESIYSEC